MSDDTNNQTLVVPLAENSEIVVPTTENKKAEPATSKFDWRLFSLIFVSILTNAGQSYVIPFYPPLAHKEANVSYAYIGILMSVKSVSSFVAAFVFGTQMKGRKAWLTTALVSQSLVMILYAGLFYITEYYWLFLGISLMIRLLEGMMRSVQQVICMAYLNIFYQPTFTAKFGLMESTASLGQILGPVIGSAINHYTGYSIPLLTFAGLYWICTVVFLITIPSDDRLTSKAARRKAQLPLGKTIVRPQVFIIFATLVAVRANLIYFNSFFTEHMFSYGISENLAAVLITIPQGTYMVAVLLISVLLKDKKKIRLYFSMSVVVTILGCMIEAPAWPDFCDFHHIYAGLVVIGIGQALNRTPSIPVLQNSLKEIGLQTNSQYLDSEIYRQEIIDMSSALLQMSLSVANLVFPSLGGFLYSVFNEELKYDDREELQAFRFTMLTLMLFQCLMFFIDLFFNRGWLVWYRLIFPAKESILVEQRNEGEDSTLNTTYDNLGLKGKVNGSTYSSQIYDRNDTTISIRSDGQKQSLLKE